MEILKSAYGNFILIPNDGSCYCEECNACLNSQNGFAITSTAWKCEKCGCINEVSSEVV